MCLAATFSSCRGAEPEDSSPPIPEEDLVEIITDILLVDPAIREAPQSEQDSLARHYYLRILEPRGYTLAEFTESMQWLQADPKRLQATYEKVLDRATTLETEIQK